jgi:hypothetical protein
MQGKQADHHRSLGKKKKNSSTNGQKLREPRGQIAGLGSGAHAERKLTGYTKNLQL